MMNQKPKSGSSPSGPLMVTLTEPAILTVRYRAALMLIG